MVKKGTGFYLCCWMESYSSLEWRVAAGRVPCGGKAQCVDRHKSQARRDTDRAKQCTVTAAAAAQEAEQVISKLSSTRKSRPPDDASQAFVLVLLLEILLLKII